METTYDELIDKLDKKMLHQLLDKPYHLEFKKIVILF